VGSLGPIQTGNIILILLGVLLVFSGPFITYRTVKGFIAKRKDDPKGDAQWFSNGLNLVIAILFFLAGILFIVNNLKGNPLA
jgi:uncharacterized membrane protein YidH (DUF202 family)